MTWKPLFLLAMITFAASCSAATYPIGLTVEGSVISGVDTYGEIDAAGTNLDGKRYSLFFDVGGYNGPDFVRSGPYSDNVLIGSFGPKLTIDHVTISAGGYGRFYIDKSLNRTQIAIEQLSDFTQIYFYLSSPNSVVPSADLTKKWKYRVRQGDTSGANWATSHFFPGAYVSGLSLNLRVDSLVFSGSNTGAFVAEPATWAMMIAGFGLLGVAMRRSGAAIRGTKIARYRGNQ